MTFYERMEDKIKRLIELEAAHECMFQQVRAARRYLHRLIEVNRVSESDAEPILDLLDEAMLNARPKDRVHQL